MKYLVIRVHSGLGNRLRALVSARRVARLTGRHLAVIWELNDYHLCCPYERLFVTPHVFVGSDFIQGLGSVRSYVPGNRPTFIDRDCTETVVSVWEENFFWVEDDQGVMWGQFSPWRMQNETLRNSLLAEFDCLHPAPHIQTAVDAFAGEHFGERMIGLHIRREDNVWSNRHCSDPLFGEAVRNALQHLPDAKIFLCTDGAESERRIRSWFGDRVITYPVRSLARGSSPEAIEDALVCLLLLSKTDLIVRSCSSTFSQVASWFGRVPTVEVGKLEHAY